MVAAALNLSKFASTSHQGRVVSFEEAWAETFDQVVTLPGETEPFDSWAEWFGVEVHKVRHEGDIMLGLLAFCPFISHPDFKVEAGYDILCLMFEGEDKLLEGLK